MTKCRIGGDELVELFSLGDLYVSNFLQDSEASETFDKGELTLAIGPKTGLVQLTNSIDFDTMYRRYWYNSGTNNSMTAELRDIVDKMAHRVRWQSGDQWLDIGCNDGTLLSFVPDSMRRVGMDPSNSSANAHTKADLIIPDYFNYEAIKDQGKFKFITAIAMFYDLERPLDFLSDIHEALEDDGLFVVQMSYLPLMLEQLAFDNICHEHLTYYSLEILTVLFAAAGFTIVDCEINDTNGGSFRVYAQKTTAAVTSFGTAPFRDVARFRVHSILSYEVLLQLKKPLTYKLFYDRLLSLRKDVIELIDNIKSEGKTIWGYGASTKGNTLLQYFGLDKTVIDGIAERQSIKFGLRTVGTEISIMSEHVMREAKPDYLLMLPWHFVYEFTQREQAYLEGGGKFIVPCPTLEVIGK